MKKACLFAILLALFLNFSLAFGQNYSTPHRIPLIVGAGKTFTVNNSLTLSGTDGTTMTFPGTSASIARTDAGQTFTGTQVFSSTITGSISANAETVTNFTGTTSLTNNGGAGTLTWPGAGATLTIPTGGGTLDTAAFTASTAYATSAQGATADTALQPATSGSLTCTTLGGLNFCGYSGALSDEDSITLPEITANYSGHGFIRVSAAGVIQESAEFESGSDGNPSLIRGTANVVVGAACADTKICIGTAGSQNPIIIQLRNGAANLEIEFFK